MTYTQALSEAATEMRHCGRAMCIYERGGIHTVALLSQPPPAEHTLVETMWPQDDPRPWSTLWRATV